MSDQYGGASAPAPRKVTVPDLVAMKRDQKRITMMTAYDAAFARLVDQAGIDVILVGDSLGMVVLGYPTGPRDHGRHGQTRRRRLPRREPAAARRRHAV